MNMACKERPHRQIAAGAFVPPPRSRRPQASSARPHPVWRRTKPAAANRSSCRTTVSSATGNKGFGGVGPAFRNDPFLKLSDHVVGQILMGRGVMPPFGDKLDDRQVAAVANYVRNSWGNRFGDVSPEQVVQIRRDLDAVRQQAASSPPEATGRARPQSGKR
jgi:hypothetical protein